MLFEQFMAGSLKTPVVTAHLLLGERNKSLLRKKTKVDVTTLQTAIYFVFFSFFDAYASKTLTANHAHHPVCMFFCPIKIWGVLSGGFPVYHLPLAPLGTLF